MYTFHFLNQIYLSDSNLSFFLFFISNLLFLFHFFFFLFSSEMRLCFWIKKIQLPGKNFRIFFLTIPFFCVPYLYFIFIFIYFSFFIFLFFVCFVFFTFLVVDCLIIKKKITNQRLEYYFKLKIEK